MRYLLLGCVLLCVGCPAFADEVVVPVAPPPPPVVAPPVLTPPEWRPEAERAVQPAGVVAPRQAPPRQYGPRIIGAPEDDAVRRMVRIGQREALRMWCAPGCDPYAITRGPFVLRDQFIPAQPRMSLPAVSPDVLARGRWRFNANMNWGNDFAFSQAGAAEDPNSDRRFFVDGEHLALEGHARYGLGRCIDVGARVPFLWRGGGFLDGLIDWLHEKTGAMSNSREEFYRDRYRVQGRDAAYQQFDWTDHGWGLGRVELDARWQVVKPGRRSGWRVAAVARVGLPTGTGAYATPGVDVGLQLAAAKQLGRRFDIYASLGGTWYSDDTIDGFVYEPVRGHGSFTVEYRPMPYWSIIVQTDASSRLITNLEAYPGMQWYVHAGFKFDLGSGWRLTMGFTENLEDQQSTTDFAVFWDFQVDM